MEALRLSFDYAALDPDTGKYVRDRARCIHALARVTAQNIVEIGQHLTDVKARLPHGHFLDWIDREFAWSERHARNYMMVHDRFKTANFSALDIDVSSLYLIAAPSVPQPVREEVLDRAQRNGGIGYSEVKQMVREAREQRKVEQRKEEELPLTKEEQNEIRQIRENMRTNQIWVNAFMGAMEAIERLGSVTLSTGQLVEGIRRFDSPEKAWERQVPQARALLAALEEALV